MKKKSFFAVIAASMCMLLTACSGNVDPKYQVQDGKYVNTQSKAVVMILGNHANSMKAPDDAFQRLEQDMDDIVYGGYFAMINNDSTPTKIEVVELDFFVEDRVNDVALNTAIADRKQELIDKIKEKAEIMADSAETDLLQALREAKSILSGINSANKEIIIMDTGLSTYGDLNLCKIDFNENPSEKRSTESIINEYLQNYEGRNLLPDLSGIDIIFYGEHGYLAPTSYPQNENMLTADSQYIAELWSDIVTTCNAKSVTFTEIPGWETPILEDEEIPHVSTVVFKRLVIPDDPDSLDDSSVNPPPIDFTISNSEIGFEADTTALVSPENFTTQYKDIAMEIQTYLTNNSDKKIYIAGAVAKYGDDNGYELSYQRAETIKKLLTDGAFKDANGNSICIPSEQIATIGLGDEFPGKVDEYADGSFNNIEAAKNRKVIIFNESSDSTSYYSKLKAASENNELYPETKADIEKSFN